MAVCWQVRSRSCEMVILCSHIHTTFNLFVTCCHDVITIITLASTRKRNDTSSFRTSLTTSTTYWHLAVRCTVTLSRDHGDGWVVFNIHIITSNNSSWCWCNFDKALSTIILTTAVTVTSSANANSSRHAIIITVWQWLNRHQLIKGVLYCAKHSFYRATQSARS